MDMNKAAAIMKAAVGLNHREWQAVVEMVERKFQTAMNAVVFTDRDAEDATERLRAEMPRG